MDHRRRTDHVPLVQLILWADGSDWFDDGTNGSPFLKYPGSFAPFVQVASEDGLYSQGGLHLINGEMNFTRTFAPHDVWNAHFAMRPRQLLGTTYNTLFFRFESGSAAGTVVAIRYNPSAQLEVMKGGSGTNSAPGTLVGTVTSVTLAVDVWVAWEFCIVQAGANSTFQVFANDVQVLDMGPTGIDGPLDLTGLGVIDRVTFRWEAAFGPEFDHYVISDDQGTFNNTRLGPVRIISTIPAADSVVGLTRNTGSSDASCVNEMRWPPGVFPLGSPDGDQTYLTGAGTFDLWTVSPFDCIAKILGVAVNADFKGSTGDTLAFLFKTGAVQTTIGTKSPTVSNAYQVLQVIQEDSLVNPGIEWVDGEINSNLWGLSPSGGKISQFVIEKIVTLRAVPYTCGTSPGGGNSYAF